MQLSTLAADLIAVSEKAAELARVIRSEHALFELLVEEKTGDSKNKRFVQDFKTLADVLVQEMVKNYIGNKFSSVKDHIFGEESNQFTNVLGETIEVTIQKDVSETQELLAKVLDGNQEAAALLAQTLHQPVTSSVPQELANQQSDSIPEEDVAVWIDPIDSTAQYISGTASEVESSGVYKEGLPCVTVLIGVYHRSTGVPIMGVANQPFFKQTQSGSWTGRCVWGISYNSTQLSSSVPACEAARVALAPATSIVMSSSESSAIKAKLGDQYTLEYAAGAGYKIVCVLDGYVGCYLLSKGSTFKWDTCSPHAILLARKGGILDFDKALDAVRQNNGKTEEELAEVLASCQLVYDKPDREDLDEGEKWSNAGGIVAYSDISIAIQVLKRLC